MPTKLWMLNIEVIHNWLNRRAEWPYFADLPAEGVSALNRACKAHDGDGRQCRELVMELVAKHPDIFEAPLTWR